MLWQVASCFPQNWLPEFNLHEIGPHRDLGCVYTSEEDSRLWCDAKPAQQQMLSKWEKRWNNYEYNQKQYVKKTRINKKYNKNNTVDDKSYDTG